ncbi:hypothetical protein SDC9_180719 [bioreactor metagenome]|uniref:Uncharacterized protein n=1 Tax=bioreactor metagenome TaxID=1076179 RepID=A0A645H2I1_9ZZZZ
MNYFTIAGLNFLDILVHFSISDLRKRNGRHKKKSGKQCQLWMNKFTNLHNFVFYDMEIILQTKIKESNIVYSILMYKFKHYCSKIPILRTIVQKTIVYIL